MGSGFSFSWFYDSFIRKERKGLKPFRNFLALKLLRAKVYEQTMLLCVLCG
jgi:hypothetical protein